MGLLAGDGMRGVWIGTAVAIALGVGAFAAWHLTRRDPGFVACEKAIEGRLVSPATAKFSDWQRVPSKAAREQIEKSLSLAFANDQKATEAVASLASAESGKALELKWQAERLQKTAREELDVARYMQALHIKRAFDMVLLSVDSQNRAGALVRSEGACAVWADAPAEVLRLDQR